MTMGQPAEDYADAIGRLLVRVYEIHERVLTKRGGGLEGIRDAAMLHAAVARPFTTFGGGELYPTDFDKAAALFHSLIKSHPAPGRRGTDTTEDHCRDSSLVRRACRTARLALRRCGIRSAGWPKVTSYVQSLSLLSCHLSAGGEPWRQ